MGNVEIRGLSKIVAPLIGLRPREHCYVMTLVCYLDDSGTDTHNQFVSIAGFIGTIDSWAAFECDAKSIMDKYGVTYIRGRDIHASDGEYSDNAVWTRNRKGQFIADLNAALAPKVGLALSFGTLKTQYSNRSRGRTQIQSSFGFSFEMLFHALLKDEQFSKVVSEPEVNISFVIEEGNTNNAEIFQRYQRLKLDHGTRFPFFSGMAFADKNSTAAIQMADLFAFLARRHSEAMEKNGRNEVKEHEYLTYLRKDIRCLGRVSTDFFYADETK